jgi:hypothetical protein
MAKITNEIQVRFRDNLSRVRNLVALYSSSSGSGRGRRNVPDTDLLRAAVVLLHATLEDLLRSLAEWKLPTAKPEVFAEMPLTGTKGRTKFGLQDLADFRGKTIDEVIADSVKEYLEKSSYNHPGDVKNTLGNIGLVFKIDDDDSVELAAMMSRRHWIAHRVDRNPKKGSGQHPVKSLSNLAVSRWLEAVERLGLEILSRF